MIRQLIIVLYFTCIALAWPVSSFAEPTSGLVTIVYLRPYNVNGSTGTVYMEVSASSVCNTNVYSIDLSYGGGKELYAAALAALMGNKQVRVEVANDTGCTGWGSKLQSIYIFQ